MCAGGAGGDVGEGEVEFCEHPTNTAAIEAQTTKPVKCLNLM